MTTPNCSTVVSPIPVCGNDEVMGLSHSESFKSEDLGLYDADTEIEDMDV